MAFGIGSGAGDIVARITLAGTETFNSRLGNADKQVSKTAKTMDKTLNASMLAGAAAFALAVLAAAKFETKMAAVNTLLGKDSDKAFKRLSASVIELSTIVPESATELADALYQVVSATVPANEAMEVLEASARGAVAGVSDTTSTFNLFSSVIKGYGKEWKDVGKVSDIAFQTIKLGQTTMAELATTMGGAIPLAASLGIGFEEVAGATAALTGVTGNTSEVMTQLEGIMTLLAKKPTAELRKAFKALGVASGKKLVDKFGSLSGAMKALKGYTDLTGKEVTELIGRKEAMVGFLALTGEQADAFAKKTLAMADAVGATDEAFAKQMDTFSAQADIIKNTVQAAFIELGNEILPVLKDILKYLNDHPGTIKSVITVLGKLVIGLGAVSAATKIVTTAMKLMGAQSTLASAAFGPLGLIIAGVAAAYLTLNEVVKANEAANLKRIDQISDEITGVREMRDRYHELIGKKNKTRTENEELYTITNDLADVLGMEYQELLNVNNALDERAKIHAEEAVRVLKEELDEAEKSLKAFDDKMRESTANYPEWAKAEINASLATGRAVTEVEKLRTELGEAESALAAYDLEVSKSTEDTTKLADSVRVAKVANIEFVDSVIDLTDEYLKNVDATGSLKARIGGYKGAVDDASMAVLDMITKESWLNDMGIKTDDQIKKQATTTLEYAKALGLSETEMEKVIEKTEGLEDATKNSSEQWGKNGLLLVEIAGKLGGMGDKIKTTINTLATLATSGLGPVGIALSVVSLAIELFGGNEEYVTITTEDLIESLGSFGDEILRITNLMDELSSKFESSMLNILNAEIDAATEALRVMTEDVANLEKAVREMMEPVLVGMRGELAALVAQAQELTSAFKMDVDFSRQVDGLSYLSDEALRMKETFGGLEWPGLEKLLQESIDAAGLLLGDLDPTSEAYATLATTIAEAEKSLSILNGTYVDEATAQSNLIASTIESINYYENLKEAVKEGSAEWLAYDTIVKGLYETLANAEAPGIAAAAAEEAARAAEDHADAVLAQAEAQVILDDKVKLATDAIAGFTKEIEDLNKQKEAIDIKLGVDIEDINKKIQAEWDTIDDLKIKLVELDIEDVENDLARFEARKATIQATLKVNIENVQKEIDKLTDDIATWEQEKIDIAAELKVDVTEAERKIQIELDKIKNLQINLVELDIEDFENEIALLEEDKLAIDVKLTFDVGVLQDEIDQLNADIKDMEQAKIDIDAQLVIDIEKINREIQSVRDSITSLKAEKVEIQIQLAEDIQPHKTSIVRLQKTIQLLGQENIGDVGLFKLGQHIDDIVGRTSELRVAWGQSTGGMMSDYDVFNKDIGTATQAIKDILYFDVDLSTTDADESINAMIVKSQGFLETLSPGSPAYIAAKASLDALIASYTEMGGIVDEEAAISFETTEAENEIAALETLIAEMVEAAESKTALIDIDITAAKTKIEGLKAQIVALGGTATAEKVLIDLDILEAQGKITTLNGDIASLNETAKDKKALIDLDITAAEANIEALKRSIGTWVGSTDERRVAIELQITQAQANIGTLDQDIIDIQDVADKNIADINVNITEAERKIGLFEKSIESLKTTAAEKVAEIQVDISGAEAKLEELKRSIGTWVGNTAERRVAIELQITQAKSNISTLKDDIDDLEEAARLSKIDIDVDIETAQGNITTLQNALDGITEVDVNLGVEGLSQVLTDIQSIVDALNAVDGNISVSVQHEGSPLHTGGIVRHDGGPVYAHEGLGFYKGRKEIPVIATEGEFMLRPEVVNTFGASAIQNLNDNLDTSGLGGDNIVVEVNEATPDTWVRITRDNIREEVQNSNRRYQTGASPY